MFITFYGNTQFCFISLKPIEFLQHLKVLPSGEDLGGANPAKYTEIK